MGLYLGPWGESRAEGMGGDADRVARGAANPISRIRYWALAFVAVAADRGEFMGGWRQLVFAVLLHRANAFHEFPKYISLGCLFRLQCNTRHVLANS